MSSSAAPTPSTAEVVTQANVLVGPKVMLEGASGTGKTYALGTLVDWAKKHNKKVFVHFIENGLESLLGYWTDRGLPVPDNLHWHNSLVRPLGLKSIMRAAEDVGRLSYEMVTKLQDADRSKNNPFHKILTACADFPDDRTGQKFGPVDEFGSDCIYVEDSLSELSNAVMKMVIGNKPTAAPSDYGVAQNNLMNYLRLHTQGSRYTYVLIAHVGRETDEITGGVKLMTKAVGKAMSGDIPQLFSDVIYTVREGDKFFWDTAAGNVDTKTRNLPIKSKITPDFSQIMDRWSSRGKV